MAEELARRLRRTLAAMPRATVSGRGLVFASMSVATIALLTGAPTAYSLLAIVLAVVVVSFAVPPATVGRLSVRRVLPRMIFAGQPFPVRITVGNGKRVLPAFGLSVSDGSTRRGRRDAPGVYFPLIGPRHRATGEFWSRGRPRGVYTSTPLSVGSSFPFGFGEKRVVFDTPSRFYVYPALGRLRGDLLGLGDGEDPRTIPGRSAGAIEFHALRRFRPGDNPRSIHWKVSARRGQTMIREFARPTIERRVVALDTGGPARREARAGAFEKAVSLAATLCRQLAGDAAPVLLAIGGAEPVLHRTSGRNPTSFLRPLAEVRPARDVDLSRLLGLLPPTEYIVLVTARPPDLVRAELDAAGRRLPAQIRVLSTAVPEIDRWFRLPEGAAP